MPSVFNNGLDEWLLHSEVLLQRENAVHAAPLVIRAGRHLALNESGVLHSGSVTLPHRLCHCNPVLRVFVSLRFGA